MNWEAKYNSLKTITDDIKLDLHDLKIDVNQTTSQLSVEMHERDKKHHTEIETLCQSIDAKTQEIKGMLLGTESESLSALIKRRNTWLKSLLFCMGVSFSVIIIMMLYFSVEFNNILKSIAAQ